jgi:hypothetical protein
LAVFKIASLHKVSVQWTTSKEIAGKMWKMTTKTNGESIILKLGNGIKQIIGG